MKRSAPRRKAAPDLSESFRKRLNAYTLAAGAAGAGLLAAATPAQAQIVYTPAHVTITPGATYGLDLNNDGTIDFAFTDSTTERRIVGDLAVSPYASNGGQNGNAVEVTAPAIFSPLALNRGAKIGASQLFYGSCIGCNSSQEIMAAFNAAGDSGNWPNVQNRFLGLKFLLNGETHYGWARMTVRISGGRIMALLTGYAYESTPNKPIIAGKMSGPAGNVDSSPRTDAPQEKPISQGLKSASLGLLALGAQGVPLWRRD